MIDFHAHILPGLDDGARSLADALAMAEKLVSVGFTHVVATSHLQFDGKHKPVIQREQVEQKVAFLNEKLGENGINLEVLPGAELRYTPYLLQQLEKNSALPTLSRSNYLLLELSLLQPIPPNFQRDLFLLQTRGYRPVLAHPERCLCFLEYPGSLNFLAHQNILYQVTLSSLSGHGGKKSRRLAVELVRSGLATFMGTDAHAPEDQRIGEVPRAVRMLEKEVGGEQARLLTLGNARRALDGEHIEQVEVPRETWEVKTGLSVSTFFRTMLLRKKGKNDCV